MATWDKGIAAIKAKRAAALLAGATPAEQAEIAALLAVPQTFREFVTQVSPKFEWYPAQELIAASLERVARGECKRLMVFMPPQEGKSQLVTRLFPAYYLTQHPDRWVGLGSYSFALAKLFSRAARDFYKGVASTSTEDASAVEFWETGGDGGLWAVGRGGSATGRSAHLAIIDDPLKDRSEAESELVRGTLHDWYGGVINMRLQPESAVIVVHTRWHEADLGGHLLDIERTGDRPEHWHIIDLPGIAEKAEDRPEYPTTCTVEKDWRQPGEPLGGRYPMQRYEQIRVVSGTREYDSQVQQRPSPSKGTIFQRQWWGRYTKAESPRFFDRTIISVDCAFKDMDDSDFVAIHVYGRVGTNVYLRDRVHARMSFTKTVAECRSMMLNYPRAVLYVEDKANGSAVIDTLRKELMGIIAVQPEGGKIARAYACQGDVEQGRCWLPDDTWMPGEDGIKGFIREATSFPSAPHDDDVDAFTQAMTVFRWELREALKAERPEPQQNEAMGWDYEKNVQRHRMTADEEMSQMLSRAGSNPFAARMSHSTIPQRTR